jgi:undecaprenyl-diphosphatase
MLTSALWGLVQGLTEFLPVSSSGHLVLIPAILGKDQPDLAITAVLHLGTLAAILWYYRRDILGLIVRPRSPESRTIWMLLIIGTIPAGLIGITLNGPIDVIFSEPWIVAVCLMITGVVLAAASLLPVGERTVEQGRWPDAVIVGLAQAMALLPGVSRSGMTMTGALAQGFDRVESARFAFLLGVPAIAAAGFFEGIDLIHQGGFQASTLVGTLVAGIVGYLAISFLVRLLGRHGLMPFAIYCLVAGAIAFFLV